MTNVVKNVSMWVVGDVLVVYMRPLKRKIQYVDFAEQS